MLNYKQMCDTSHWQGEEIFSSILDKDNAVIMKATQGVKYVDDMLFKRFLICLSRKVTFLGIYHYLDKRYNGIQQALHFYTLYKRLVPIAYKCGVKIVPILDYEEGDIKQYNDFRTKWYELTNTPLTTYTSVSWLKDVNNNNTLLWVAGWTNKDNLIVNRIEEYPTCILYQFTNCYCDNEKNILNVDRNYLIEDRFNKLFIQDWRDLE